MNHCSRKALQSGRMHQLVGLPSASARHRLRVITPHASSTTQAQHSKKHLHGHTHQKSSKKHSRHGVTPLQQEQQRPNPLPSIASCRALVLDSSYRPIDVVTWQRAICLDLFDKVDVLEYFESLSINSAREQHMVPAVLRVRFFVKRNWNNTRLMLSRRNIMLRDRFCCQYCGARSNLTLDHVVPASKGGDFSWENMVTACMRCNGKKGNKSLEQMGWKLRKPPGEPSPAEVAAIAGMGVAAVQSVPKEWQSYLFPGQMPLFSPDTVSL